MGFIIKNIEFTLPKKSEKISFLKLKNKDWEIDNVIKKTGIIKRYLSNNDESTLSLAKNSVSKILKKIDKKKIDFVIFVSQTYLKNLTSAANIIQFTENRYKDIKENLKSKKINLR